MSISDAERRSPPYPGAGSAKAFDFDFMILSEDELLVPLLNTNTLELLYLEVNVDFEVFGAGNKDGGYIELLAESIDEDGEEEVVPEEREWLDEEGNLAEGYSLQILGKTPRTQRLSIRSQGKNFDPALLENALDKGAMIDQEQQEEIDRSIKLPPCYTGGTGETDDFDPELPTDITEKPLHLLRTNALSKKLELVPSTAFTGPQGAPGTGFENETSHDVVNGQAATDLEGEVFDGEEVTSVLFFAEIIRGTTVTVAGQVSMHYKNGTWERQMGGFSGIHGVTFSVSQATTVGQLRAALNSGAGNGTIKFKKIIFAA